MADSKLEIIITAKDNASGPLGKIGSALGGMAQIAGGFIVANLFGKIADSVTGFFSDSLGEARESIAIHKQLEQVIKSTGGVAGITAEEADKLATSLSLVTNFTDDTILSAENMLLTFTNVGEKVFPRATETILDMSQALGQDTKSSAIQLGKALNDPIKGITALQRVGVTFTDQQKEMIKAMVEAGDIAGAQGVILDELAKEFGGSAQALADPAIQLQNAWDNLKETVGMSLVPILNNLAQQAFPLVQQAIEVIQPHLDNFSNWVLTVAMPAIQQFIPILLGHLIPAFQQLGAGLSLLASIVLPLLSQALQFVINNFNIIGPILAAVGAVILALSSPITAIIAGIVLLATAWANNWFNIQGITQRALEFLAPYWEQLKTILNQFIIELLPVLEEAWKELRITWVTSIQPALAQLWGSLQRLAVALGFGTGKTDFWKAALGRLKIILDSVVLIIKIVTPLIRFIGDAIAFSIGMTNDMVRAFSRLADGLRGVSSAISRVIGQIRAMASALSNISIPSWLKSNSPTDFEVGLRGIADAMSKLPDLQSTFNVSGGNPLAAASPLGFAGASSGEGVVVNLTYSPVISTADKFELERVLTEVVNDINRKRG